MEAPEANIGKIIPAYNGTLSERLIWDQDQLDAIAKESDLRTTITIREGDAQVRPNYENLGNTLAWKVLGNPMDLFRRSLDNGRQVEVAPVFHQGKAEVYVNHHLITQQVLQTTSGKFDDKLFTKTLDQLAHEGIRNIIEREKTVMAARSLLLSGVSFATMSGIGAMSYIMLDGTISEALLPPPDPLTWDVLNILDNLNHGGIRVIEILVGVRFALVDSHLLLITLRAGIKAQKSSKPYTRGFNDLYNPLKPTRDYLAGYISLNADKPLVRLKPQD